MLVLRENQVVLDTLVKEVKGQNPTFSSQHITVNAGAWCMFWNRRTCVCPHVYRFMYVFFSHLSVNTM